jgi:hypothetical protein
MPSKRGPGMFLSRLSWVRSVKLFDFTVFIMVTNFVLSVSYAPVLVSAITSILVSLVGPWLLLSSLLFFQSRERIILILSGAYASALELSFHSPCWFFD